MHYIWPRAVSTCTPSRSASSPPASPASRKESTGKRPRTIYSITDAGRAALTSWLASPSSRERYESEALIKILFAENGTLADLRASIRSIRDEAAAGLEHWRRIADAYEAGEGQYPERFAVSSVVARLLGELQAATVRWADWAEQIVSRWAGPRGPSASGA